MTKARTIADLGTGFVNISDTGTEGTKVASGTTAQRGSTTGQIRFNTTTSVAEYYDGSGFKIIDTPPTVTAVSKTLIDSNSGTTSDIVITGTLFANGATVLLIPASGSNITPNSTTFNNTAQITITVTDSNFVNANEPYAVKVTNPSGTSAILESAINVDTSVAWSTSAGSLGTIQSDTTGNHFTVSATDSDGDTITYSVLSGSLPGGLSLNSSTGVISGDPTDVVSSTTTNFTLRASTTNANADRAFSITVTPPPVPIDFLVIAGGGSAANSGEQHTATGGGGAGGMRSSVAATGGGASPETTPTAQPGTVLTITIGAGGAKSNSSFGSGSSGSNSSIAGTNSFTTITSIGGGKSPGYGTTTGVAGGSGGGVGQFPGGGTGGAGTAGQGFAGGNTSVKSQSYGVAGSGGGGAAAAGSNNSGSTGGNGGNGASNNITGSSVTYAGGGGAGGASAGSGGSGGGGNAGAYNGGMGSDGATNKGGGGGGTGSDQNDGFNQRGGNGGSGVVIIRVPTNRYSSTSTGSPSVTTSGSNTILTFNSSGTYTV
jgi:hypothetical protein|tara:strand:- start:2099 stop:3733 length:1635 start_codon:yes stop_codon:yes gene_type:complete